VEIRTQILSRIGANLDELGMDHAVPANVDMAETLDACVAEANFVIEVPRCG